jgi:Protein of unknown function (DUF3105)
MNRRERRQLERERAKLEIGSGDHATNLETIRPGPRPTWITALMIVPVFAACLVAGFGVSHVIASRTGLPAELKGIEQFTGLERNHVTEKVSYLERPPVGGNHASIWQNCGVYRTPIRDETAVHSLEHGAVWIAYNPRLEKHDIRRLEKLVMGKPYRLLSPYPGLGSVVAVMAWGERLRLSSVDAHRIEVFAQRFVNGPHAPEKEWMCVGGTGKPIWEAVKVNAKK